ncbi:hypothetical protein EDD18DRAFT_1105928 [Armillaria luteobubalina]|uniref:Uncharacterized protein n=1 Tax=Armillaria luteobubalina TaxID=153913 RepID=A0AA39UNU0_9AGAR|nr:hypothetical protein EDD18DRAFT_1105928 [Armillaria luteobubalina]
MLVLLMLDGRLVIDLPGYRQVFQPISARKRETIKQAISLNFTAIKLGGQFSRLTGWSRVKDSPLPVKPEVNKFSEIRWLPSLKAVRRAQWRDKDSSSLSLEDIHEILWELAEVNFHIEFQALDRKLCSNESIRHQMLIGQCFPNGKANMLHRVPLGSTNYGLTHSNWLERALYIFAMRRCMQQWNNCPLSLSPSSDQKGGYSESEVEVIEQETALLLC